MSDRFDVVIVGAGHGGAQAAIALRQHGFDGSIALVGDEPDYPYERPPLSKEYLAGEKAFARMLIRPPRFWSERNVTMMPGRQVVTVDPVRREVGLSDGNGLGYGKLIWSAGGAPRKLACAGNDLAGVHTVRTRADVDAVRGELAGATRVVVIGGGYIGLETAAVLTGLGKQVCLLEAQPRVLARVAGEPLSRFYEAEHRARGVELRTGVAVECITGAGGRATGVQLADGEIIAADLVIVGIGIIPAVKPLLAAGAKGGDGVLVDEYCRTSLTDIHAIGDCAAQASRFAGGATIRIESVQNATDQASVAAKNIVGAPTPYVAVPWFWSNQYDLRLQTVGLSLGCDETVLRGDPAARSFSLVYLRQGRVIALDCVNATRDYVRGRKLVSEGLRADRNLLADVSAPLKAMFEAA